MQQARPYQKGLSKLKERTKRFLMKKKVLYDGWYESEPSDSENNEPRNEMAKFILHDSNV